MKNQSIKIAGMRDKPIEAEKEIKILREILWLRHGCSNLYGDDGEMQCGSCALDFKRDSAEKIKDRFDKINYDAMIEHFEKI